MGLKELRIVFDNPWSTYYPGQTVTGRIIVVVDSVKKIRGINVKIKGEANTCWATDRQELNHEGRYEKESETVTGHEEYFNIQSYVVGTASGDDEIILPIGEHSYPFTCALPQNLPSSFEHDYGHVRYTVKAIIDRPWKFDQEVKAAFTVVSHFDLNREARASEPIHQEMSKTFCCLCCGSPPLKVNVILPVKGYVPGQSMAIRVNVDNQSGIVVETVKLILRKIITFKANTPRVITRTEKIVVAEVSKGPVEAGGTSDYEQKLEISPLPPSNLTNCGIIDLEYNLKIEACVQGWYHRNLKSNTLVFIGTIPLANYQGEISPSGKREPGDNYPDKTADPTYGGYPSGYPPFSPGDGYPTAPPQPHDNNDTPVQLPNSNVYSNLPPPSYEEYGWSVRSLRERGESDYVMGNQGHFAPRYPVYNFMRT
ncbi:arrestin domain-containing protein 17 isoform X1 [Diachasma alloeum]|uniref:arrestin domain-containing protein 17 isoform X1 n=1 Tax=Diachasma alloeum TaxID=454923 RepID=UPI00073842EF|nr:arrestin domain-containing protein 17 isoform X1 [Diachasma alloeum]